MSAPRFTADTLKFLRGLKRNNRRDWFNARRDDYEAHVRQPMMAIVERLSRDLLEFAPELVADPRKSLFRIHRDTRFSPDKSPYKTHAAAVFPPRGFERHRGAGLYFHIGGEEVWIGGGLYAPDTSQLVAIREHIGDNVQRLRTIVESPAFRRHVGRLEGERLRRVPRGYPQDHPAAEFLRYRQFIAGREFPPPFATGAAFYRTLLRVFAEVAPLVRFLNEPLSRRDVPVAAARTR